MARNNKNKRFNAGNRHEARSRTRDKSGALKRHEARDDKVSGAENLRDYRDPGDDRYEDDHAQDFQVYQNAAPRQREVKERQVKVAGVPKGKLSHSTGDKVYVAHPALIKPSTTKWVDYRRGVLGKVATAGNVEARKRLERQGARSDVASEVLQLAHAYGWSVDGTRHLGYSIGQGQANRELKRMARTVSPGHLWYVPDYPLAPVVVLSGRYVKLPFDEGDLPSFWVNSVGRASAPLEQGDDVPVAIPQSFEVTGFFSDLLITLPSVFCAFSSDSEIKDQFHGFYQQMLPKVGLANRDFRTFSEAGKYVRDHVGDSFSELKQSLPKIVSEHGGQIAAMCAELYAASLVPEHDFDKYHKARSVAAMALKAQEQQTESSNMLFMAHLTHPTILRMFRAFFPKDTVLQATPQSYLVDLMSGRFKVSDRGAVVTGVVALVSAIYVMVRAKTEKFEVARTLGMVMKSLLKIPKIDTPEEALTAAIKYFPIVFAGIAACVKLGSVSPLFGDVDTTFTRFVDLSAAYELHNHGQYPNTHYATAVDFGAALDAVYQEMKPLARANDPVAARNWALLVEMRTRVMNNVMGQWKQAPYSVAFVGESSIGKSDIMSKVCDALAVKRFGRVLESTEKHTIQPTDKYQSGLRMDHKLIILDDVANTKPVAGATTPNPCSLIIEIINNVMVAVNSADLADKGAIAFNPAFCFATSNVQDLGAGMFSNEPISVLRRFDVFVRPTVRERFRKPNSYALDPATIPPVDLVAMPDLWVFDVLVPRKNARDPNHPIVWDSVANGCDVYQLLDLLENRMERHFEYQKAQAEAQRNKPYLAMPRELLRRQHAYYGEVDDVPFVDPPVQERVPPNPVEGEAPRGEPPVLEMVPQSFRPFSWVQNAYERVCGYVIKRVVVDAAARITAGQWLVLVCASHVLVYTLSWILPPTYLLVAVLAVCAGARYAAREPQRVVAVLPSPLVFATISAIVVWLLVARPPRKATPQGLTAYMAREREGPSVLPIPEHVSPGTLTRTFGNLRDKTVNVGVFAQFTCGGVCAVGVLFPVKTGFYVINRHIVAPLLKSGATVAYVKMHHRGSSQEHVLSIDQIWEYPGEFDIAFIRLQGPSEVDLTESLMPAAWLSYMAAGATLPSNSSAIVITRTSAMVKAGLQSARGASKTIVQRVQGKPALVRVRFGEVITTVIRMEMIDMTEAGDCGSHLISAVQLGRGEVSMVLGLLAGYTDVGAVRCNVFAPLTRDMFGQAVEHFTHAVFQSAVRLFNQPLDRVLNTTRVHPHLPIPPAYVKSLGVLETRDGVNTVSQNSFKSNYLKGICYASPRCDELLGPLQHKFPNQIDIEGGTRSYVHYAKPLAAMGTKLDAYDENVLRMAELDLLQSFRVCAKVLPSRPATLFEACNLTEDLPALVLSTAAGFGRVGSKLNYVEVACNNHPACGGCARYHPLPHEYKIDHRQNFYPKADLLAEVEALESALKQGRRDLAIFKAALKDEPIGLEKHKIRAFYVGMTSLNLLVRQYLMPLVLALAQDARFECMVGIDVDSQQWEDMQCSLEAYDKERRIGGDYSGFDLSTHPELLESFYRCLVALARDARWSPDSIAVVENLGKNLAAPVYIFLGMAVSVAGSNPSGVAITTHTNSAVNSLIHRYAFYKANPKYVGRSAMRGQDTTHFLHNVRICTYGDDVVGAVRHTADVPISNYAIRDAAADFGMVYGAIDKSSELPDYYHAREVQFLKRDDVYVPALGRRLGRIALASIRKCVAFERSSGYEERRSTMASALRLYYPHAAGGGVAEGPLRFAEFRLVLLRALADSIGKLAEDMPDSTLPSYEDVEESIRGGVPQVVDLSVVYDM